MPYQRDFSAWPKIGQIISPDVPGKVIATWPGKSGGWITYLVGGTNSESLMATTNPKFNPNTQTIIPLICFVNIRPDDPGDCIEIRWIAPNHVKGMIVC